MTNALVTQQDVRERRKRKKISHARNKLEKFGIDVVLQLIEDDVSYEEIAKKAGVLPSQLGWWLFDDPEYYARSRDALRKSGRAAERKAEKILLDITKDSTHAELVRARELAHHYRWRAKVRDPERFGDRNTTVIEANINVWAAQMPAEERLAKLRELEGRAQQLAALTAQNTIEGTAEVIDVQADPALAS